VQITGAQLELYNQIKKAVSDEIKTNDGDHVSLAGIASRTLRLRQILNHPALIDGVVHFSGESAKYLELDDILEEILSHPETQVLVWTQWRGAVEMLVKRYREYGAIALYGGSDEREVRDKVLSKKARVVIAVPEKAATSIDWLKVCRTAVYLEKPWYLTLYRQSLDRIDRRTDTDPALIISIEAVKSVDQLVNAALKQRQDVFDAVSVDDEKLVAMGKESILGYLQ
jgi:SNF2 family DNA or RNA helicase